MFNVQLKRLPGNEDVQLPQKMSLSASGFDLYAAVTSPVEIGPGQRILIPTGLTLAMPPELEAQIAAQRLGFKARNHMFKLTRND